MKTDMTMKTASVAVAIEERPCFRRATLAAAIAALGTSAFVHAGPQDGRVVAGSATISHGTRTDIDQASSRAVIDWRSFSIGRGESVYFHHRTAQDWTLNRVTGTESSQILGTLAARGNVILLNPNGVLFGAGSRVDVGGLIASTSWLDKDRFIEGKLDFTAPRRSADGSCQWSRCEGGSVVNQGTISAGEGGLVALVAPHVRNDGQIWARLGRVTLGSADSFTVDLHGDRLYDFHLSADGLRDLRAVNGEPIRALVDQAGSILADGGRVALLSSSTAKSIVDNVINMSGVVRADSTVESNGTITLAARSGRIDIEGTIAARGRDDANAGQGGTIQMYGSAISLGAPSWVDVGGRTGGGTVTLAGVNGASATQAGFADPQSVSVVAQSVQVQAGAAIVARASQSGSGGSVIIGGETVQMAGLIDAQSGGTATGASVRIEAGSGLRLGGDVTLGTAQGRGGSAHFSVGTTWAIAAEDARTLSLALRSGGDVTVASAGFLNLNGTIDGRGGVSGGGLTLNARDNIALNRDILTEDGSVKVTSTEGMVVMKNARDGEPIDGDRRGAAIFAGSGPIELQARGNVNAAHLVTRGEIRLTSQAAGVTVTENIGGFENYRPGSVTVSALGNPTGDVILNDVHADRIDVRAYRNIVIPNASARPGFDNASSVVLQSTLLDNLWANPFYRTGAVSERMYTEPWRDRRTGRTGWLPLENHSRYEAVPPSSFMVGPFNRQPGREAITVIRPAGADARLALEAPQSVPIPESVPITQVVAIPETAPIPEVVAIPQITRGAEVFDTSTTAAQAFAAVTTRKDASTDSSDSTDSTDSTDSGDEVDSNLGGAGRGIAQAADLGRGSPAVASDVFTGVRHVVQGPACSPVVQSNSIYFHRDSFGQSVGVSCR